MSGGNGVMVPGNNGGGMFLAVGRVGGDDRDMPDADNQLPGGVYCRQCGYDLRGQAGSHRCPECGREFDPGDGKTFLTRPMRGAGWRWVKRGVILVLTVGVLLGMVWGWLYWEWRSEQAALAKMRIGRLTVQSFGGDKVKDCLGSAGWILDRVRGVSVIEPTNQNDLVYLKNFKELGWLVLDGSIGTDAGLAHIKEFKRLPMLYLDQTNVTDVGLAHITNLNIEKLFLRGTRITDAGLVHLKKFKGLRLLFLDDTDITDVGLGHLGQFKRLENLGLARTRVTDAGLIHVRELKGLRWIDLDGTKVTPAGIEKLKAALPGIGIDLPGIDIDE